MATVHCNSGKGNVGRAFACKDCKESPNCKKLLSDHNKLITFWSSGKNGEVLHSESYGTCVGMALIDPNRNSGVLTHCWGVGNVLEAMSDATDILEEWKEKGELGPEVKAIVFGGSKPKKDSRERIDGIVLALAASGCPAEAMPEAGAEEAILKCGQIGGLTLKSAPKFFRSGSFTAHGR